MHQYTKYAVTKNVTRAIVLTLCAANRRLDCGGGCRLCSTVAAAASAAAGAVAVAAAAAVVQMVRAATLFPVRARLRACVHV